VARTWGQGVRGNDLGLRGQGALSPCAGMATWSTLAGDRPPSSWFCRFPAPRKTIRREDRIGTGPPRARTEVIHVGAGINSSVFSPVDVRPKGVTPSPFRRKWFFCQHLDESGFLVNIRTNAVLVRNNARTKRGKGNTLTNIPSLARVG
jgi:hypothetical protein